MNLSRVHQSPDLADFNFILADGHRGWIKTYYVRAITNDINVPISKPTDKLRKQWLVPSAASEISSEMPPSSILSKGDQDCIWYGVK